MGTPGPAIAPGSPDEALARGTSSAEVRAATRGLAAFQRITYTKAAVVLGFAAGFLLSHRLWISSRSYPVVPIVRDLPAITFPLDYVLAGLLFFLLVKIALASRPRAYILGFTALLVSLAVFDQNRWQPWVYLYAFVLLALASFSWRPDDTQGQQNTLNICRLLIVATYFYSGLQKMNPNFANVGLVALLGPSAGGLPMLHLWPWILASVEMIIGLVLMTRKLRNIAVLCGIGMHLFILFSCIVIVHWNSVVWPWNLAMMAFLVLLFWNAEFSVADVLWRNPVRLQKLVLLLFAVLPALSFFGWWDSYLSASLYSANVPQANILLRGDVKNHLPAPVQQYVKKVPGGTYVLNIRDWSMGELNVPPYPAMRAYRTVGADICKYSHNSPDVLLVMLDKDTLLEKASRTQDSCLSTLVVH